MAGNLNFSDELNRLITTGGSANLEAARQLLAQGADASHADINGYTPLFTAAFEGKTEFLELLLENGADVNPTNELNPLIRAVASGRSGCVRLLLEAGADVNCSGHNGQSPLVAGARFGQVECVKLLLASGADVNPKNGTVPLLTAVESTNWLCVQLLLEHGANISSKYGPAIFASTVAGGHGEIVRLLIEKGADVNQTFRGKTALRVAVDNAKPECVNLLLQSGAIVNFGRSSNCSPLLAAVENDDPECVKLLLDAGAKVNLPNSKGQTVLSSMWLRNRNSDSPIWLQKNKEAVVKLLLAAGAHVNSGENLPPFMLNTATHYHEKTVPHLLLAAGYKKLFWKVPTAVAKELKLIPDEPEVDTLAVLCRKAIRKHLLTLDPHTNLFIRVPQLQRTNERAGLPEVVISFLLYNQSLEVDWAELNENVSVTVSFPHTTSFSLVPLE